MVVVFGNKIIRDGQNPTDPFTIDDVPLRWRADVLANLNSRGYDGYGLPL